MNILTSLLGSTPYLEWPRQLDGWLGGIALLAIISYLVFRWRAYRPAGATRQYILLIALILLVPASRLLFGIRLPPGPALPPPGLPIEPKGPALMVFGAVPWALAGGLLGPVAGAALGFLSGLLMGLWDTHSPFTALEYSLLGTLFGAAIYQRYRTPFYRLLRHPIAVVILLSLVYPILFAVDMLWLTSGTFAARLDFAIMRTPSAGLALAGELLIAGIFAQVVRFAGPNWWGGRGRLKPSPTESSLAARFQYAFGALIFVLAAILVGGIWYVAGNAARQMLEQRMADTAQTSAETIPFFLEAGQNLITQVAADPGLYTSSEDELKEILASHLRSIPYFRQLYLLDADGVPVTGFPIDDFNNLFATPQERVGFDLARQGVTFQYYTVPPLEGEVAAQISFIATVLDPADRLQGILVGRADLASNPFTRPIIRNLNSLSNLGGEGMLVDEDGRILYHPSSTFIMTLYTGRSAADALFYDDTAPDGTRRLVYYRPVIGRAWAVVMTVPAQQAQQLALNIAAPLLILLAVLSILVFGGMRIALQVVTGSLRTLGEGARRISQDDLDYPLEVAGVDEIGELGAAFEKMRVRLQGRLEELNRLLLVSQGVAGSLEIDTAVKPILEAGLSTGAAAAYLVLAPSVLPELIEHRSTEIELGPASDAYRHLHAEIIRLAEQQEKVVLSNPVRARSLNYDPEKPIPQALIAMALRHESQFYGVFWLAHEQPHQFSDEEIRFLATVAGQAALAVANTRLFLSAEIGRQRLEAILASTPDPVLVTDRKNRLLLANPAALEVLHDELQPGQGLPIGQVIAQKQIVALLEASEDEQRSAEIELPGDRFYHASATSVLAEGRRVGRVCVLQEITQFKELDELKSEFVALVSHDLRLPLTLLRGYATMLQMVGDLNEQQTGYVGKILASVEKMSRLVNNLLDSRRLEAGVSLKLEMVPVVDMLEQVTGDFRLQAAQKRIGLDLDIPPHTTRMIQADLAFLQQALQNLVENAIKFTEPGGQVTVRVQERNERLVFVISDTGIGIAPVDQLRLFEKFYRGVRREARSQRGSGLGLAIVKSIAERHGGRTWVESQLGKGSHFYLEIPINQSANDGNQAGLSE